MRPGACAFCSSCIFVVGRVERFCDLAGMGEPDNIDKMDGCPKVYPGREQSDEPTGPCAIQAAR